MKTQNKIKFRMLTAFVLVFCILLNPISGYATEQSEEEEIEYWGLESDLDATLVEDEDGDISLYGGSLAWTVPGGSTKKTAGFYKRSGDTIMITGSIYPENTYIAIGIVQPDGTTRFNFYKNDFAKTFTLTQSGYYKIFAQNTTNKTIYPTLTYR